MTPHLHGYAPQDFDAFQELAPLGFCTVLRLSRGRPAHVENRFPSAWRETYERRSYALRDPAIGWALGHDGAARWSELSHRDPAGVIAHAHAHGLHHGLTVAAGSAEMRSFCGLARADRPFLDSEAAQALHLIERLHALPAVEIRLTEAQYEALSLMASGERHTRAAAIIGISESALKARLKSARGTLGARTTAEAVHAAQVQGLI